MQKLVAIIVVFLTVFGSSAGAQTQSLEDFIVSIDRTPVSFKGSILFDRSEGDFRFVSNAGDFFGVSLDAGRDAREAVEEQCEANSFFVDTRKLCEIEASGTVEIRGGRVFLSIESVLSLVPPTEN